MKLLFFPAIGAQLALPVFLKEAKQSALGHLRGAAHLICLDQGRAQGAMQGRGAANKPAALRLSGEERQQVLLRAQGEIRQIPRGKRPPRRRRQNVSLFIHNMLLYSLLLCYFLPTLILGLTAISRSSQPQ